MKYTSLIIDNNAFFRNGFTSALAETGAIDIIADTSDAQYIPKNIPIPDVIFIGHHLVNDSFIEAIQRISPQFPSAKYILIADNLKPFLIRKIMDLGIHAIIKTTTAISEILDIVKKVIENGYFLNDYVQQFLLKHYYKDNNGRNKANPNYVELSEKEISVINYMAKGLTACEIADHIHLSKRTVEGIRLNLIEKTKTKNSVDLVIYGIREGIISI